MKKEKRGQSVESKTKNANNQYNKQKYRDKYQTNCHLGTPDGEI